MEKPRKICGEGAENLAMSMLDLDCRQSNSVGFNPHRLQYRVQIAQGPTNPSSERTRIDRKQALIQRTGQPSCLAVCERSGYSKVHSTVLSGRRILFRYPLHRVLPSPLRPVSLCSRIIDVLSKCWRKDSCTRAIKAHGHPVPVVHILLTQPPRFRLWY